MTASNNQIGGTHYTEMGEFQPWDVLQHWLTPEEYRGYQKGVVIAYLAREHGKGGDQDIRKAAHSLQKLVEVLDAAEAQHAATAPVVIPPAPDYLPDSVALDVTGNTASQAAPDGVAANAADDGLTPWGGGECPVKLKNLEMVDVKYRNGYRTQMKYPELQPWTHFGCAGDITAYRIIKKESAA